MKKEKLVRALLRRPARVVRRCLWLAGSPLRRMGGRCRGAARLYYAGFHSGFAEEQRAFLAGRNAYAGIMPNPDAGRALLRRNIHRLEKGLLMRPRRIPFAVDYIGETVSAYAERARNPREDPRELQWAADVLEAYFSAHAEAASEPIAAAAERFAQAPRPTGRTAEPLTPYRRDLDQPVPVSYDALWALAKRRRSVRWFLPRPVPRALLDQAIELAALAPSACNRQPFEFRVFDEPELVQKIVEIPYGLQGYGHNVPCLVVLIGQQRNFFDERDRHLIYIDGALAVMGFVLALETLGLSSCCVNWPEIAANDKKMAECLRLSADERPVILVAVGFPDPDGLVARSVKKSLKFMRRYNFE